MKTSALPEDFTYGEQGSFAYFITTALGEVELTDYSTNTGASSFKLSDNANLISMAATIVILSIAGVFALCMSGALDPLAGGCPKNLVIFYILVWGSALLTGISLAAPFWVKLYDLLTEGPLRASFITSWLEGTYLKKNEEA